MMRGGRKILYRWDLGWGAVQLVEGRRREMVNPNSKCLTYFSCQSLQELILTENLLLVSVTCNIKHELMFFDFFYIF